MPMPRYIVLLTLAALALNPTTARAQRERDRQESEVERQARLARAGAGLRVGHWALRGLRTTTGGTTSSVPALEGWHQRGLDRHVSLENSIALWGRREKVTQSGGPLGGTTTESVGTYVVPLLTSIQLHPFTGPEQRLEPFLRAGAGFAIGIENREGSGGSLFGGGAGTSTVIGFALQGGGGVSWRFARAFGMSGTVGYRWTHFGERLGGLREYKGLLADVGLFYRFQYR